MPRKPSPKPNDDFMSDDFLKRLNTQLPVTQEMRPSETIEWFDVEELEMNPFQPREFYDEGKLEEMVQSLDQFGMIQPALARPHPAREGRLQLIVGHRRREAIRRGANAGPPGDADRARFIGKMAIRVVPGVSDLAMLTMAIEENETRHDLNPIERGKSYRSLRKMVAEAFGDRPATWADVEKVTGLSYRHMKRTSDLLDLPPTAIDLIRQGEWTERHGRAILSLSDAPKLRDQLIRQMIKEKLSARAADQRAKDLRGAQPTDGDLKLEGAVKEEQQQIAHENASTGGGSLGSGSSGGGLGGRATSSEGEAPASLEGQGITISKSTAPATAPAKGLAETFKDLDESPLARRLGAALVHVREAMTEIGIEPFARQGAVFELLEEAESQLDDALSEETNTGFVDSL